MITLSGSKGDNGAKRALTMAGIFVDAPLASAIQLSE